MVQPELPSYQFHTQEWDEYEELYRQFEWAVPETFNTATYVCDRWADAEDRTAIVTTDGATDFGALKRQSDSLATYLSTQGVGVGDRVAIEGAQRVETVVAFLAAWKVGAVAVPISSLYGSEGLRYRLEDSDTSVYFTAIHEGLSPATAERLDDVVAIGARARDDEPEYDVTPFEEAIAEASPDFDPVETAASDPASIIYTSGSTGKPKGVVLSHEVVLGCLPQFMCAFCDLSEPDLFRTPVEWSWVGSLYNIVLPCLYYGRPVLAYSHDSFDSQREIQLIANHDVSHCLVPPTALRRMVQTGSGHGSDLTSVDVVGTGGEAVGRDLVESVSTLFPNAVVHNAYGQTEATGLVGNFTELGVPYREDMIGRPTPGHDVRIVDPQTGDPTVEPGTVGEIAVRYEGNPVCFTEYLNKPEKTESKVQDGWLLTEDLGVEDQDGYIAFHSRKDDVIISSGYRIGPQGIEETLTGHEAVLDAGVVGVPDEERGEIPKAFVVLAEGASATEELKRELQTRVKDQKAKHEYPREIEFIDELPKTTTGKVQRSALQEREETT